jgi:hypothetical protein
MYLGLSIRFPSSFFLKLRHRDFALGCIVGGKSLSASCPDHPVAVLLIRRISCESRAGPCIHPVDFEMTGLLVENAKAGGSAVVLAPKIGLPYSGQ